MTELALLAEDPTALEAKADPVQYVVLACERAKAWLTDALEHGDIDAIVETKSQAEAIRVYTAQKQMGMDAELAATEIVRRAERGIGVAIRRGQETGEIGSKKTSTGPRRSYERGGRTVNVDRDAVSTPISPTEYFGRGNAHAKADAYRMAEASDEEFDAVIEEAKDERNLTRTNVTRKLNQRQDEVPAAASKRDAVHTSRRDKADQIRDLAEQGYSSRQMAPVVGVVEETLRSIAREYDVVIPADKAMHRSRRHDSNRIAQETVNALAGLAIGVDLINYSELDIGQAGHWVTSLDESLTVLNQFSKDVRKVT